MSFFIRSSPGAIVTFNLSKLERFNKQQSEVAEVWENDYYLDGADNEDEAPLHLIARLRWSDGQPWITAHYGSLQVLNAPIILFADDVQGKTVSISLRDYSNRSNRSAGGLQANNQCIKRLFKFTFLEAFEACVFRVSHNIYLKAKTEPHLFEDSSRPVAQQTPPAANYHPPVPGAPVLNDEGEENVEDEEEEESANNFTEETLESAAQRLAIFEGSDPHTFQDDQFENTQGYDFDESF